MPRTREDGVTVWYNSELTKDELFAGGLVRAVQAQELMREKQTGRKITASPEQFKEEVQWLVYFLRWFQIEFGIPFPGRSEEWLPKYRRGLDGLAEKGIVADLKKGRQEVPGAATISELYFPALVWWDRIEQSPVVYKEGA